jgi:hypothetical protein
MNNHWSLTSWWVSIMVLVISAVTNEKLHSPSTIFRDDVQYYYAYLPAVFIHHDIGLHYLGADSLLQQAQITPVKLESGARLIKMACGTAVCYAPFFFLAHGYSLLFGNADGYASPYAWLLVIGGLFYAGVSLLVLRNLLLRYFSDAAVAFTIISILLGTNLFYYAAFEGLMSHVYACFAFVMVIWFTIQFFELPRRRSAAALGFFCGLSTIIRPNDAMIILVPMLYGITSTAALRNRPGFILIHWKKIMLAAIAFLIPCLLQMWYWKVVTGHWFYYSYQGEPFYFNDPQFLNTLFSYRKGWLLYTPVMVFSLTGFFFMFRAVRKLAVPILFFFLLNLYVLASWWCWWYGGSFGNRAFVESYGLMIFPLAAFFETAFRSRVMKMVVALPVVFFIFLNLFQTDQYREGIIHYDRMGGKAYWIVFLKPSLTPVEWKELDENLHFPQYNWWKEREKYQTELNTRQYHE